MNCLPDVNCWLAISVAEHVHHEAVWRFYRQAEISSLRLCRFTQSGLLRLLTTSEPMGGAPFSMAKSWSVYDSLLRDKRVSFAEEPPALEAAWRLMTSTPRPSPKLWNDAYLAAFAELAGLTIVTFDVALAKASGGLLLPV